MSKTSKLNVQIINDMSESQVKELLAVIANDCILAGLPMMNSSELLESVIDTLREKGLTIDESHYDDGGVDDDDE